MENISYHVKIQEDQLNRLALQRLHSQTVDAVHARPHGRRLATKLRQSRLQRHAIGGVIVNYKDSKALEDWQIFLHIKCASKRLSDANRIHVELGREGEGGSATESALHRHFAAKQPHQVLANGQAQSRAAFVFDVSSGDTKKEQFQKDLPYWRVIEASACENGSNRRSCSHSEMPMPVSFTSNLSTSGDFDRTETSSETSPYCTIVSVAWAIREGREGGESKYLGEFDRVAEQVE
jgi:hypothetical protein